MFILLKCTCITWSEFRTFFICFSGCNWESNRWYWISGNSAMIWKMYYLFEIHKTKSLSFLYKAIPERTHHMKQKNADTVSLWNTKHSFLKIASFYPPSFNGKNLRNYGTFVSGVLKFIRQNSNSAYLSNTFWPEGSLLHFTMI